MSGEYPPLTCKDVKKILTYLGFVARPQKGKFQHLITDSVRVRTELSTLDVETRTGIEKIVEAKTRHIAFFDNATTKNVSVMMAKIDESTSILEHRHAQATIKEGREVV